MRASSNDAIHLTERVIDKPDDEARHAMLADYLHEHPEEIAGAVRILAEMIDTRCSVCEGKGGSLFEGGCHFCNGSGERKPKWR